MKIALLHISDFHLKDGDIFCNTKIDKFVDSLKSFQNIDDIIILISGDIVFSGGINEYKTYRKLQTILINKLKEKINDKFIPIYLVPGNHDIDYNKLLRKGADIEKAYRNNNIDRMLDDEFNSLNNFYSQTNYKFSVDKNRLVAMHIQKYNNFNIQINLINTAPFSTLEHDDRELHYFQENDYPIIEKRNNADFCLTMMHHPSECFHWNQKFKLKDFIANNNHILFVGHEHKGSVGEEVSIDKSTGLFVSRAGEMQWGNFEYNDFFNTIIIDTCNKSFSIYSFEWDNKNNIYKKKEHINNEKICIKAKELLPSPDFLKELNIDENILHEKLSYDEYFVFPTLIQEKTNEDEITTKINNFSDFSDFLCKYKKIWIRGDSFSGKSTLAKYLFNELIGEKIPLILRVSNGKSNLKTLTRNLFAEQYGYEDTKWNKYEQLDNNEKIIIVDDFDLISNKTSKEKLLKFLNENFQQYIIISNNNSSYDIVADVREEIKDSYEENGVYGYLNINPFFGKKRRQLVKKICLLNNVNDDVDIVSINKLIDALVHNNASLFTLKPNFIIQYTNYFLQDGRYESKNGEAIFSKIFEHNINSALIKYSSNSELDETLTVIEEIAYYMHFNKKDTITYSEMEAVINDYCENYDVSISIKRLKDTLIKSNIFKEDEENGTSLSLYFQSKNYLSYFVAKCLYRKLNNDGEYKDIENILEKICFGINSDIVLFISYLSNNTRIINTICEYANELMSEIESVSFETDNIKLLSNNYHMNSIEEPNNEDKSEYEKRKDDIEEITYEGEDIEARGIYDYDETEIDETYNKLLRSIKYTEMICKALPAFYSIMRAQAKNELVKSIFSFPNKIIFSLLEPVSNNLDDICAQIKNYADEIYKKNNTGKLLTEEKIVEMLSESARCIFLSVYNSFSELAVNRKSLSMLLSYQSTSIANEFFKLSILDNSGNTDEFFKEVERFMKKHNKPNLRILVQQLVRKHLICNNISQSKKQRIVDKVWGKHARKKIMLTLPQGKEI